MAKLVQREVVIARIHSHARALLWPSLLLVAVCVALGFFGMRFSEPWQNFVVLGAAVVLIIGGWLLPLLAWLAHNYTITNRRVVLRAGIFVRVRQELLHSRAFDVTVRRSAIQTLFGTGDVLLNLGGEGRLVLRDVASPDLVQATLHELIQAQRNAPT